MYGSGIFIAKYLDLITRLKLPKFAYDAHSTIEDQYVLLSIELLSGKLLNEV